MTCGQYTESAIGRTMVVTSSTRPTGASRYVGQRIYETDTSRELLYDGTGWVILSEPIQTYTPSFVNLTVGNGTLTGKYHRHDGFCDFDIQLVWGTTTSISASPVVVSLPVAAASNEQLHSALYVGASRYPGKAGTYNSTNVQLNTDASPLASITATSPHVWASTYAIIVRGSYPMTTRYS